jgi:glycosyltransferase involved in cell wall biosynthesis
MTGKSPMHFPIVIAAYNRDHTLTRLLSSLAKAHYSDPVKLIISIDGGGPDSVKSVAREFEWKFGSKEVIEHPENLGLRRHILFCGGLSQQYDGIILLEDDLYVSRWFYQYTIAALDFYRECKEICGVSLYSYQYNETALFPFKPLNDGSDVYFMQLPCSWGQAWLKEHWAGFKTWYDPNAGSTLQDDPTLPSNIAFWPETSWKKYFLKYMAENRKFFVYPRDSYTTNFGDMGQHHLGTNVFQVPLVCGVTGNYRFMEFDECLVKYDVFCEMLPDCLVRLSGEPLPDDLSVDLYGSKRRENLSTEYVITSKKCNSYIKSFGKRMFPAELNIINQISGNDLFLTRVDQVELARDINGFICGKAIDISEQKYYFHTDDIHYSRLRNLESKLDEAEQNIRMLSSASELSQKLQRIEVMLTDSQARLQAVESSRLWRLTAPLRKVLDVFRRL